MTPEAKAKLEVLKDNLRKELQGYEDQFATSGNRIKLFVIENSGKVLSGDTKVKHEDTYETISYTDSNFAIRTVNINTITNINENKKIDDEEDPEIKIAYNTKETPIIQINNSVDVKDSSKGFCLLTLIVKSDPISVDKEGIVSTVAVGGSYTLPHPTFTYSIAHDVSTDLIFKEKNTGFNEPYILKAINDNKETYNIDVHLGADDPKDENKKIVQTNNLLAGKTVNLYSDGPVVVYGKLSGTGQILSQKSVYFQAGTQLNTSNYMKK